MKSKDIIYERQEGCDTFEKSFSASATRTGMREGTEQSKKFIYNKLWDRSKQNQLFLGFTVYRAYAQHMQQAQSGQ